jgi:hypothetical protein
MVTPGESHALSARFKVDGDRRPPFVVAPSRHVHQTIRWLPGVTSLGPSVAFFRTCH